MEDVHRQRLLALADLVESQPHVAEDEGPGFCMSDWVHRKSPKDSCGTPSCIWGWAEHMRTGSVEIDATAPVSEVDEWLGITTGRLSLDLFSPTLPTSSLNDVTPSDAAKTLRKLAETGRVDWSHADPDWRTES